MVELDNLRLQGHTESVRRHFDLYLDRVQYELCRNIANAERFTNP